MAEKVYRIRDWDAIYENHRSRQIKSLDWVPIPNRFDGTGYRLLVMRGGAAAYGVWCAIVGLASRCTPRGTLVRDIGIPHTAESIAAATGLGIAEVKATLDLLCAPDIGWLELIDKTQVATSRSSGASSRKSRARPAHRRANLAASSRNPAPRREKATIEGKGTEGKGIKLIKSSPNGEDMSKPAGFDASSVESDSESDGSQRPEPPPYKFLVFKWNRMAAKAGLPTVRELTEKRKAAIRQRYRNRSWRESWEDAIEKIPSSAFLLGENDRGWKANFDWFLRPDSVTKLLEGFYGDGRKERSIEDEMDPRYRKIVEEARKEGRQ